MSYIIIHYQKNLIFFLSIINLSNKTQIEFFPSKNDWYIYQMAFVFFSSIFLINLR